MATKKDIDPTAPTEAFVLCDCLFGESGQVITLTAADAESGAAAGVLDLHPDAIAAHRA